MCTISLLIVEDSKEDISTCEDTLIRFNSQNGTDVKPIFAKTIEDALNSTNSVDGYYDGIVIDLNIGGDPSAGQTIITKLCEEYKRSPIVVFTGTPDNLGDCTPFRTFTKGEDSWDKIFDYFVVIDKIGIKSILGEYGVIEKRLWEIYSQSLRKRIHVWQTYTKTHAQLDVQEGLLRFVLNHLNYLLDNGEANLYRAEFYIELPSDSKVATGSIVLKDDRYFLVVTPACDLVVYKGSPKSDRIQIVEIDTAPTHETKDGNSKNANDITKLQKNSLCDYLHYLPDVTYPKGYVGGYANFRRILSVSLTEYTSEYTSVDLRVAPSFIKDIVARFSRYYGRQGQPDLKSD